MQCQLTWFVCFALIGSSQFFDFGYNDDNANDDDDNDDDSNENDYDNNNDNYHDHDCNSGGWYTLHGVPLFLNSYLTL